MHGSSVGGGWSGSKLRKTKFADVLMCHDQTAGQNHNIKVANNLLQMWQSLIILERL
jgi:hypothetical protein